MPSALSTEVRSRFLVIDQLRTHYLEAGDGPPVVLLHSGEYGASAELSWEFTIDALAQKYHVIAPDWLGFGRSAKLYDFESGSDRRIQHLRRFLETLGIGPACYIGSSMGGSVLTRQIARNPGMFDVAALVLSAGGGFVPNNAARAEVINYDCTLEGMRKIIEILFHDPSWAADDDYLKRRFDSALVAGAWEATAAARFRSPNSPPRTAEGQADKTRYEDIRCPTYVIAGADDKLREPGYAAEIAARLPNSELAVYENCGHLPHIEAAERFNADVLAFLDKHPWPTSD